MNSFLASNDAVVRGEWLVYLAMDVVSLFGQSIQICNPRTSMTEGVPCQNRFWSLFLKTRPEGIRTSAKKLH